MEHFSPRDPSCLALAHTRADTRGLPPRVSQHRAHEVPGSTGVDIREVGELQNASRGSMISSPRVAGA